ncbi:DUF2877 domain-containing protein [Photobacterium minamisatsumaniensis]|uniref:DUF2877 domain-containing protein n=1 Tax=Photobacterium minamisatsumaniensis TaxID=2910233 RepID=UPI003D0C26C1
MMILEAIACSRTAPSRSGSIRLLGRSSKAINFVTEDQRVLTLHREGCGLGPSGWMVADCDFMALYHLTEQDLPITLSNQKIELGQHCLHMGSNPIKMMIPKERTLNIDWLETRLASLSMQETGLYGILSHAIRQPIGEELNNILYPLKQWLKGDVPNWRQLIGAGPGLTPSHDDMIVGMLFVAYHDEKLSNIASELLPESTNLYELTTSVSASYLEQARNGFFSEPLLNLSIFSDNQREFNRAISRLLQHGHYSGADTLLGIYLCLSLLKNQK